MAETESNDKSPSTAMPQLHDWSTATAPPLPELVVESAPPGPLMGLPSEGQTLGDFHLERLLGTGSFGKVFLARQISLNRLVALKVSFNRGHEAQTLASLEHDHIVRVFSEAVDPTSDLRLLCMQYIPGTTLERIIEELSRKSQARSASEAPVPRLRFGLTSDTSAANSTLAKCGGREILAIVDEHAKDAAALDLAALRDRELLAGLDFIEAGCWMGARLAEALAHAHRHGVLHRDIKPANILVNRYGRPMLVDFNVASTVGPTGVSNDPLGGTLNYMSPEHLDAFSRVIYAGAPIDARGDIWSLGVVLYELFAGRRPFALPDAASSNLLKEMIEQRRKGPPPFPPEAGVPAALQRVIAKCLAPRPEDRFQDADELAEALESCLELRRLERSLPRGKVLTRLALSRPFLTAAVLLPLPHVLGSIVNITYNTLRIVRTLDPSQKDAFFRVLIAYNVIVYPLFLFLFFRQVVVVFRTWRKLTQPVPVDPDEVARARRQALRLPLWAILVSCLGWLPGGVIFPLAIDLMTGSVPPYGEFVLSFTISGLIAMTYSWMAVEFVVVRVLYPGLWLDARNLRSIARNELGREEAHLAIIQFLAVLIPISGASLLLGVAPEQLTVTFRLLVASLLAVGMVGLGFAILAAGELRRTIAAIVAPAGPCLKQPPQR